MFDLNRYKIENDGWSVRMKRPFFEDARRRLTMPVVGLTSGLMMMALALTASANDGMPSRDVPASPVHTGGSVTAATTTATATVAAVPAQTRPKTGAKARRWLEIGIASWYGQQFQGRRTAGGERFDMNTMTCAHPTLPMGTWLRVTNLRNRRTVYVRVNDRGPVVDGRIVDLSYAAARSLGLAGIAKVKLEAVRECDPELDRALVARIQMPVLMHGLGR
jgi:rare lipoprotein A